MTWAAAWMGAALLLRAHAGQPVDQATDLSLRSRAEAILRLREQDRFISGGIAMRVADRWSDAAPNGCAHGALQLAAGAPVMRSANAVDAAVRRVGVACVRIEIDGEYRNDYWLTYELLRRGYEDDGVAVMLGAGADNARAELNPVLR